MGSGFGATGKQVSLRELAGKIPQGASLALGGSFLHRGPFALVRELIDVELVEITLTSDPAYQDTTVAMRSRRANVCTDSRRLWLETC